jgi:hypothetical protein
MDSEVETVVADHVAAPSAPYAAAFDGRYLVVRDEDGTGNVLKSFDAETGQVVSTAPLAVAGWITAIAFEWHREGSYDLSKCTQTECAAPCSSDGECGAKHFCNLGCCEATIY